MAFSHDILSGGTLLSCLLAVLALYTIYGAIWRLYFSPVAHVPGPLLARLTFWNEFYYDVVCGGQYTWKLLEYHERYGPVIRINPYEVHIKDSDFVDQVYVGGSKRVTHKWAWSMRMFGQYDESAFDTLHHDKHRMRREPWGPYFSKQSVSRLQPTLIQDKVNLFCKRLAEHQAASKPVIMIYAYACLTTDIISDYSYPKGYNYLTEPDFDKEHYDAWMSISKLSHVLKQFGWLFPILNAIPISIAKYTSPDVYLIQKQKQGLFNQCRHVIDHSSQESKKSTTPIEKSPGTSSRPSLLQAIYESPILPPEDKSLSRLACEAQTAIAAGTLTSSHILNSATYHILANPRIFSRLMSDLETAISDINTPNPPTYRELENMGYLVAIMYESFRIAHAIAHRLQRIFPDYTLTYPATSSEKAANTISIPPGTPVSMSPLHIHTDASVFPSPYTFSPERWLPLSTNGHRLQRYLMSFGGGSRICVGMELGKAEILTGLCWVFRRFGRVMRLATEEEGAGKGGVNRERDVDVRRDFFNAIPGSKSRGVVVMFGREVE